MRGGEAGIELGHTGRVERERSRKTLKGRGRNRSEREHMHTERQRLRLPEAGGWRDEARRRPGRDPQKGVLGSEQGVGVLHAAPNVSKHLNTPRPSF